jgi:hypothetical protein
MEPFEAAAPVAFYLRRRVMIVDGLGGDLREGREIDSVASRYFLDDASSGPSPAAGSRPSGVNRLAKRACRAGLER